MKKRFQFFTFLLTFILGFFILCEFILRVFFTEIQPQGIDKELISENRYGNSAGLTPNISGYAFGRKIQTNELGFRKYSKKRNTKKPSWLHLGDSVTMGVGVDDDSTFSSRIARHQDSLNVLNPSVVGFSVQDYLNVVNTLLIEEENKLNIKKITIFYCMNDIYSKLPEAHEGLEFRKTFGKLTAYFREKYRTYILLKGIFFDRPQAYYLHDSQFYKDDDAHFEATKNRLLEISKICTNLQVNFDLCVLPYEFSLRKKEAANEFLADKIVEQFGTLGITSYCPIDPLKNKLNSNKLYLFADGIHFSNEGHKLVSQQVLTKNNFLGN